MNENFYTVVASLLSTCILLISISFYRFIFPRKSIKLFHLLILFLIPPILSNFRFGIYESGDFTVHIYRSMDFFNSLSEGNFLPSWAGHLNAGYGYPLFIFNYTLPYYFICLLHLIGLSFVTSLKLFLAINFLLSGIFMFFAARKLFNNELAAFVVAILYQFAPYHLVDIHFGIAIGEVMIFTLMPLTFLLLQRLWTEKSIKMIAASTLAASLLVMSHVLLASVSLMMILTYSYLVGLQTKKKSFFFLTLCVVLLTLLASSYVWLGPLMLSKYTIMTKMINSTMMPNDRIADLIYSPWKLGFLFQGPKGEVIAPLGYAHIIALIIAFYIIVAHKSTNKFRKALSIWVLFFSIVLFMATPYSTFIWEQIKMPILSTLSHRLLLPLVFLSSFLAGYVAMYFEKKKLLVSILIGFAIYSTILNWGQRRVIPSIGDAFLQDNLSKSTYEVEGHWYANSRWRDPKNPWFKSIPKFPAHIIKGKGTIHPNFVNTTRHEYLVSAATPVFISENTLYFPGWRVFDNETLINSYPDRNGTISYQLEKGLHLLRVEYDDTMLYKTIKLVSITTLTVLIILLLKKSSKK